MEAEEAILRSGGLILAVDDQPMNLDLVDEILSEQGFEVITTEDGFEALELVKERTPDCIVLDIMMPGIDGFEVCSASRATAAPGSSRSSC